MINLVDLRDSNMSQDELVTSSPEGDQAAITDLLPSISPSPDHQPSRHPDHTYLSTTSKEKDLKRRGHHASTFSSLPRPSEGRPPPRDRMTTGSTQHEERQHYKEYIPAGGMYVLYEDKGEDRKARDSASFSPDPSYDRDIGPYSDRPPSFRRGRGESNTFIGEIDGRFSFSEGRGVEDYVRVEVNADGSSTSHELMQCKKTVLKPYLIFLKVIGWRRLRDSVKDLKWNKLNLFFNFTYPALMFLILATTIVTQQLTCSFRTKPAYIRPANNSHLYLDCTNHVVVGQVIPGFLILAGYLYGVYLFRFGEPEHIAALMETVFLSYSNQMGASKKKIIRRLRSFLVLGSLWIILDICLNILRMASLRLFDPYTLISSLLIPWGRPINSTTLHTDEENVVRYVLVVFSFIGFMFFDLLYFAVVVAYASQSELIQYYIVSIIHKVRAKTYSLQDAIKDIKQTYTYMRVLNSKLSTLTTLLLFVFLNQASLALYNLAEYPEKDPMMDNPLFYIGVLVGIGNILQWALLATGPLIQAARLTTRCRQLRRLGLEIGSRPFVYAGTPQLDLHYFVQYTDATRYTAKLASVPIYPSFVVGLIFLGGIVATISISINNHFVFAPWF